MSDLAPPKVDVEDTGAHELESHEHSTKGATSHSDQGTPGGLPIPKTVVEKVEPDKPSHGEVPGTEAFAIRTEDATPDEVRTAPDVTRANLEDMPTKSSDRHGDHEKEQVDLTDESELRPQLRQSGSRTLPSGGDDEQGIAEVDDEATDGGFDDFDDFEEGGEHDVEDFGDFDDAADQDYDAAPPEPLVEATSIKSTATSTFPILDFQGLSTLDDIEAAMRPYMTSFMPNSTLETSLNSTDMSDVNPSFLTERSQSLWAQLVAPPPLQPPDWIRSRIRRLFLVSLGVPVDLDEILPASKQKKLVLPSVHIESGPMHRRVSHVPASGLVERMKEEDAASATGGSTKSKADSKRKGMPGSDLDLNAARLLCSTTDVAMHSFSDAELEEHVSRLSNFRQMAEEMLQQWTKQRDSALGDKRAFEEVIENLVKHAQKIRK